MSVKNPDTGKAHTVNIRFTADQKKLAFVADPVHGGLEDDAAQQQGGGYSPPAARSWNAYARNVGWTSRASEEHR